MSCNSYCKRWMSSDRLLSCEYNVMPCNSYCKQWMSSGRLLSCEYNVMPCNSYCKQWMSSSRLLSCEYSNIGLKYHLGLQIWKVIWTPIKIQLVELQHCLQHIKMNLFWLPICTLVTYFVICLSMVLEKLKLIKQLFLNMKVYVPPCNQQSFNSLAIIHSLDLINI